MNSQTQVGGAPTGDPSQSFFMQLTGFVASIAIISGPILAYTKQYLLIKQTSSVGAFSYDVCGIILFGQAFRILFWFGAYYDINLFIQSVCLIFTMFFLLEICVRFEAREKKEELRKLGESKDKDLDDLNRNSLVNLEAFWRWPDFKQYFLFYCYAVFAYFLVFTLFYGDNMVNLTGMLSNCFDAAVAMPQAYKNWNRKSVENLSLVMIGLWFLGDSSRLGYYIVKSQPSQFVIGGILTVTMDVVVLAQFIIYAKNQSQKKEVQKVIDQQGAWKNSQKLDAATEESERAMLNDRNK